MSFKKIKISIVEDCLLSRIALKGSLSSFKNIEILKDYDNASDFVSALKKNLPDIVLMDLNLKGMNGIEAIKAVKEINPDIKIIILTEHNSKDFFLAGMYSGANAFVLKETETKTLYKVIEAVNFGAYWFDSKTLNYYKNIFPEPNSLDLNNLYDEICNCDFELTKREKEVLRLIVKGKTNIEIAKEMFISKDTVKAHVANILNKIHVTDRVQAAVMAVKFNII